MTTPESSPQARYEAGRAARAGELAALEKKSRAISALRVAVAVAAVALTAALVWATLPKGSSVGLLVLVALFATLAAVHSRVLLSIDRTTAALRFHERGIARLAGSWQSAVAEGRSTGEEFLTPNHPYLGDLDIFGKASLFQLLDQTETRIGAAYLASWLKGATGTFP